MVQGYHNRQQIENISVITERSIALPHYKSLTPRLQEIQSIEEQIKWHLKKQLPNPEYEEFYTANQHGFFTNKWREEKQL